MLDLVSTTEMRILQIPWWQPVSCCYMLKNPKYKITILQCFSPSKVIRLCQECPFILATNTSNVNLLSPMLLQFLLTVVRRPVHIHDRGRTFQIWITSVILEFLMLKDTSQERKRWLFVSIPSALLTWGNVYHPSLEQSHRCVYRYSIT
jgi:hypothetical protein